MKSALTTLVFWFPMVVIGMLNGILRVVILSVWMTESTARQVATITLIILLTGYVSFVFERLKVRSYSHAFLIGLSWAALTFFFETVLGYFGGHLTLAQIFEEYDLSQGRLWSLVIVALIILPMLFLYRRSSQLGP